MAYVYVFSFYTLAEVIVTLAVLCVAIWAWGCYLDEHEHNPGPVRTKMFAMVGIAAVAELGLAAAGIVHPWVAVVSLICNIWGGLDAVLRFPAAHDLESFFATKLAILLVVKTFAFTLGFVSFRMHIAKGLAVLLLDTWALPVLYLMALPLDENEHVAKDEESDWDLAYRAWRLLSNSHDRQRCFATCQQWYYGSLRAASACSKLSPLAERIQVCHASPEYQRTLQRRGRSV